MLYYFVIMLYCVAEDDPTPSQRVKEGCIASELNSELEQARRQSMKAEEVGTPRESVL